MTGPGSLVISCAGLLIINNVGNEIISETFNGHEISGIKTNAESSNSLAISLAQAPLNLW